MKSPIVLAASASALMLTSLAHAEVISYEFSATLFTDNDADDLFGLNVGDVVTGTFSYETDGYTTQYGAGFINYSEPATVTLDGFTFSDTDTPGDTHGYADMPGFDDRIMISQPGGGQLLSSTGEYEVDNALHTLWFVGDQEPGVIPDSLDLTELSAYYRLYVNTASGQYSVIGATITSLTLKPTAVPELSGTGSAASIALLAGMALVLTGRRRRQTRPC